MINIQITHCYFALQFCISWPVQSVLHTVGSACSADQAFSPPDLHADSSPPTTYICANTQQSMFRFMKSTIIHFLQSILVWHLYGSVLLMLLMKTTAWVFFPSPIQTLDFY